MSTGGELTSRAALAASISTAQLRGVAAAAAEADQPRALCRSVDALVCEVVGHRLFSISIYLPAMHQLERIYSSDETTYPVGGRKLKQGTAWAQSVLERGETFLGPTTAEIRDAFDDHDKIFALGLGSIVNVPLRFAGATLGTMNIADREHRYSRDHAHAATALGQLLLPAVMARSLDGAHRQF